MDREEVVDIGHDFYFFFIWIQYFMLGISIFRIDKLQDALSIVQTNSLWMIRLIQSYLSTTKGWFEFFGLAVNSLSISTVVLFIIFWTYDKKKMILLSVLIPLVSLNMILLALKSQSFVKGLRLVKYSGLVLSLFSSVIIVYFFLKFIWRFYSLNKQI